MNWFKLLLVGASLSLVLVAPSRATTVFNDGLTHSVSGLSDDIVVNNGTTLNVILPAFVRTADRLPGVLAINSSHVFVSVGRIDDGARRLTPLVLAAAMDWRFKGAI